MRITFYFISIVCVFAIQALRIEQNLEQSDLLKNDKIVKNSREIITDYSKREAYVGPSDRWPNATVPYLITYGFYSNETDVIYEAIGEFHNKTCVRWVDRTNETDFVFFTKSNHCGSYEGRTGGCQNIFLKPQTCFRVPLILHEMMHTIGFVHQHSRSDRDNYVTINTSNIKEGYEREFEIDTEGTKMMLGPYDFNSVMHYPGNHYSRDNTSLLTIEPVDPANVIQRGTTFSSWDVVKINRLYRCMDFL